MTVLLSTDDGPVEGWSAASWRHGISQTGAGQIDGDPALLDVSGVVTCSAEGPRFRWRVEDVDRTDDDGSTVSWSGRGLAADLERTVVLPAGFPSHTARQRTFTGWAPLRIWRTLALEAQARGRLSWLTIGFTDTVDSNGDGWTETVDVELDPGVDLLGLLESMCEVEGAEWIVDPDGTLRVAPQIGTDRSGEVVLFVGRDQLARSRRQSTRDVRQTVYLEASTGVSVATSSADPDAGEIWLEGQDFSAPSSRSAVAAKLASQLGDPKVQVDVTVDADCGLYDRFQVGDIVGLDDGVSSTSARVVAAAVAQADQTTVELTLVDQVELRRRTIERAIEANADVKLAANVSLQRRHGLVRADRIETGSLQADAEIRSTDYVAGSQGWRISGSGDVEFSSGTFRGTLDAASGTFTGGIAASQITSGTIDAVRIPNLSAEKITTGTMVGNRISGGTITGVTITGGTLNTTNNRVQISGNNITLQTSSSTPGAIQFSGGGQIVSGASGNIRVEGTITRIGPVSAGMLVTSANVRFDQRILLQSNELTFSQGDPAFAASRVGMRAGQNADNEFELQARDANTSGVVSTTTYRGWAGARFRVVSSRDYKQNIADAPAGALELLRACRVREYDLREPDGGRGPHARGLVVEEMPEQLVCGGDGYDVGEVLATVVQAVQELADKVEELSGGR